MQESRGGYWIAGCCAAIIGALYVVGAVSGTGLRHFVQTLPIWLGVVAGMFGYRWARWAALPFFLFWLIVMVFIWLFLLGWARIVSGHFTPAEVAMTVTIGIASLAGIAACLRAGGAVRRASAVAVFLISAGLQFAAFRVSLLPGIARR